MAALFAATRFGVFRNAPVMVLAVAGSAGIAAKAKRSAVIVAHVIGILQDVPGQHGNNGFFAAHMSGGDKFPDARHRGGRGRLATDSVAPDHRFRVGNLLLAHGNYASAASAELRASSSSTRRARRS